MGRHFPLTGLLQANHDGSSKEKSNGCPPGAYRICLPAPLPARVPVHRCGVAVASGDSDAPTGADGRGRASLNKREEAFKSEGSGAPPPQPVVLTPE